MKNQILVLAALPLISAGCIITASTDRSDQVSQTYSSAPAAPAASDDPYPVLDAYGNWIDVGDYGRVWQPAVAADWRPYSYGQWVWTDRGWMWDSDEPFGWVVYHYGEWTQMPALGWVWVPGSEWSPARVDWYSEGDYVGWAPMAPPHASYPEAYHSGYENYWTMVPAPQFTRLNVGAYRTVHAAPPQQTVAPPRGRAVNRPPDIITIQGATHQLISPRKTEQDQVKVGRREVSRVRVAQDDSPAPVPRVYGSGSPAPPDNNQPQPPAPGVLPPGARTNQRPRTPAVVAPPPVEQRAPTPIRVTPAPAPPAPATQNRTLPEPAPVRVTPPPVQNRSLPAPAPVRATPAPVQQRVSVPDRPPERKAPDRTSDKRK
jgi:hypothetical protein